jgi:hypothetical protein
MSTAAIPGQGRGEFRGAGKLWEAIPNKSRPLFDMILVVDDSPNATCVDFMGSTSASTLILADAPTPLVLLRIHYERQSDEKTINPASAKERRRRAGKWM